jgi:DNA gyrase subunit B
MYIGSTGPTGLHHLIWECVDNSIDEVYGGFASVVSVVVNSDGSVSVSDDGRGIPTDIHPLSNVSALETVMTVLHAGGKFGGEASGYQISGGLHGVGISVVNALSDFVKVRVRRDNVCHTITFNNGVAASPLAIEGLDPVLDSVPSYDNDDEARDKFDTLGYNNDPNNFQNNNTTALNNNNTTMLTKGTTITFLPSLSIFKSETGSPSISFDKKYLETRMSELSFLNPGLTMVLEDRRPDVGRSKNPSYKKVFKSVDGLSEYCDKLCHGKTPLLSVVKTNTTGGGISNINYVNNRVSHLLSDDGTTIISHGVTNTTKGTITTSIAIRYSSDSYTDSVVSFVNNIKTKDHGCHVDGMKTCLTRIVNQAARRMGRLKEGDSNIIGEYVREGMTAVVSVSLPEPEFEGQTKGRLGNTDVKGVVDGVLSKDLTALFEWRPDVVNRIIDKSISSMNAANAAKAARDMIRRKTLLTSSVLPGKLSDCQTRDNDVAEIFIVEGDSAAGSAKQGRDRFNQAILPLRGKILNIERAGVERIYQNTELQSLISAIGIGVKNQAFDVNKLRYKKIIIMTDADVDGAHIRVLLLTFFYRYQRKLIEEGYVYCACPPLYKITTGKKSVYVYDEEEKNKYLDGLSKEVRDRCTLQRFKGLGEMMPQQLWETTMDPEKRTLKQVTIQDAEESDLVMSTLMGGDVGPRKEFVMRESGRMVDSGDLDF